CALNQKIAIIAKTLLINITISKGSGNVTNALSAAANTGVIVKSSLMYLMSCAVSRRFSFLASGLPRLTIGTTELAAFVVVALLVLAMVTGAFTKTIMVSTITKIVTPTAKAVLIGDGAMVTAGTVASSAGAGMR